MISVLFNILAIVSSIFASMCCSGQYILNSLGINMNISFFAKMASLKPLFVLITGIFIVLSYNTIENKNLNKNYKIIFWIMTIISIFILYSPSILMLINKYKS